MLKPSNHHQQIKGKRKKKVQPDPYRVLHGISGNNSGVVPRDISGKTIRKEANTNIPLRHEMGTIFPISPDSADPHPALPVLLLHPQPLRCRTKTTRHGSKDSTFSSPKGGCQKELFWAGGENYKDSFHNTTNLYK